MAKVEITDGSNLRANVTPDNELRVSAAPYPPFGGQKAEPFRQYLTLDGTPTGSNDMGVDGSVTEQCFYVQATDGIDRYITNISIIMGYGTSGQPYQFADAAALTNGVRIYYESQRGIIDLHEGMKSNQDIFRLAHDPIKADWEVRGVQAINDYGYFMTIDLESFMPVYGVKLDANTGQRLVVCIRDNCTNADTFNMIAYGFDRFQ